LMGAGLPQLVGLTGKSKSYAERLFDFPAVGALKPFDARNALSIPVRKEGVSFEAAALEEILRVTRGTLIFCKSGGTTVGTLQRGLRSRWALSRALTMRYLRAWIKISFECALIGSRHGRKTICAPWPNWDRTP
jgi:hypothetical protein